MAAGLMVNLSQLQRIYVHLVAASQLRLFDIFLRANSACGVTATKWLILNLMSASAVTIALQLGEMWE